VGKTESALVGLIIGPVVPIALLLFGEPVEALGIRVIRMPKNSALCREDC